MAWRSHPLRRWNGGYRRSFIYLQATGIQTGKDSRATKVWQLVQPLIFFASIFVIFNWDSIVESCGLDFPTFRSTSTPARIALPPPEPDPLQPTPPPFQTRLSLSAGDHPASLR